MAQDLDTQLLDAIEDLRKSPTTEWEAKKAVVLELFSKGANIPPHIIENLESYLGDLEQEHWDDKAVYAGRSIHSSDEYELFNILSKLNNAKDKKKSLNALFKVTKSKGVTLTPKNKTELKKLIKDRNIYLGDIDVSKITNFKDLFKNSRRRDFGGIETWDVSKVTTMESCFEEAEFFNHNIEAWDVSKVKNMERMFYEAVSFNQPLNAWNIANVESFREMFAHAKSFDQNLESWGKKIDLDNGIDCEKMFWFSKIHEDEAYPSWSCVCENGKYIPKHKAFLEELINSGISPAKIDTSEITDMSELFKFASWDNERFSGIESWNVSNVTKMFHMFYECKNFNRDISNWDVSNVTDMRGMFRYCENFRQDLSKWNVSAKALLNCEEIFYQCPTNMLEVWNKKQRDSISQSANNAKYLPKSNAELKALCKQENIKLSDIDTSLITDMSRLFTGEVKRKDFSGIESWDTSNVVDMSSMFGCSPYFNHNIESWNVSKVKNMEGMFYGAEIFNQPLDKWDVSRVENFEDMFYDCKNFNQNLDSWKLSEAGLKNAIENKNNIFHRTKLENNFPKWLKETQKIPESVKEICDLLKEMCEGGYKKGKAYFTNYYNLALQGLKALLEKKKVSDKDLARIYGVAMGEREFYKEDTIGNCPLELLELIKDNAKDYKIALKIGEKDKKRKMSFLDNATEVGRVDIVKFLFEAGECIESLHGLRSMYSFSNDRKISDESMAEMLRLYKAYGLKETDIDLKHSGLYILALEHKIFSKEEMEKELKGPLLKEVIKCYEPWQRLKWLTYLTSTPLSQEEKKVITDYIKENKDSQIIQDYLEDYKAILENIGEKGIL
ncbi:hypothetical protein B6S12_06260 [Helicobacter valdiviensis]|uniref:BspA family leucine-rich repeat surface protein n=1 Tax=Helicobacter valdiviensis TaxID=1458358 RepID=A0A2W6MXQ1_9HELI|nr:BspA family leucine-rich repeat surface protein [Helicobacter valdiviensis]PZT47988.1 hypothetical protein B6S12_06260 [Helicobacter valdiviensis]